MAIKASKDWLPENSNARSIWCWTRSYFAQPTRSCWEDWPPPGFYGSKVKPRTLPRTRALPLVFYPKPPFQNFKPPLSKTKNKSLLLSLQNLSTPVSLNYYAAQSLQRVSAALQTHRCCLDRVSFTSYHSSWNALYFTGFCWHDSRVFDHLRLAFYLDPKGRDRTWQRLNKRPRSSQEMLNGVLRGPRNSTLHLLRSTPSNRCSR